MENKPERQPQPTVKEQAEMLDFFWQKGLYWEITPDKFPSYPVESIALAHFFAINNAIDGLQTARHTTSDPDLRRLISVLITNTIKERDRTLLSRLSDLGIEGEVDEELISNQAMFRQPGELGKLFDLSIGGFAGQLHEKNFPALRAMSQKEKLDLRLWSIEAQLERMRNRKKILPKGSENNSALGFQPGKVANAREERLEQEIDALEGHYNKLLDEYLNLPPS